LLKKIVYAGSNNPAFKRGSQDLLVLAEVTVPAKQVERLTERIGKERQDERDAAVAAYLARPLTQREDLPPDKTPPQLAVVEMDGGRLQIRTAKDKPDEAAAKTAVPPEGQTAPAAPAVVPQWSALPACQPQQHPSQRARPTGPPSPSTGVKTRSAVCSK